jgi:dihydrofolate reductase
VARLVRAVTAGRTERHVLRHGLLDELLLFVHPVVLGSGRPLFDHGAGVVACDLIEHATFPEGVVMHRYAIRH